MAVSFGVSVGGDDEVIDTTEKLEKMYQDLIDDWNRNMIAGDTAFQRQLINAPQALAMNNNFIYGSFISQYLALLFGDFVSISKNNVQAQNNQNNSNHYVGVTRDMLTYYSYVENNDKQALLDLLGKSREYYLNTKTRFIKHKK